MPTNAILTHYMPTGIGPDTAAAEHQPPGIQGAIRLAQADHARFTPDITARIQQAAAPHNLPSALLMAIASRESHAGQLLDAQGYGDSGHAFGWCQTDQRSHAPAGQPDPASQGHWDQTASILTENLTRITRKHPDWPPARQLQGAIAAYNIGIGNIDTLDHMDSGTTHNDYSNDVWTRALHYAGLIHALDTSN